jgi:hypothetical protein
MSEINVKYIKIYSYVHLRKEVDKKLISKQVFKNFCISIF